MASRDSIRGLGSPTQKKLAEFRVTVQLELFVAHPQSVPTENVLLDGGEERAGHFRDGLKTSTILVQTGSRS